MPQTPIFFGSHLASLPTDWGSVTLAQAQALAALGEGASVQACLAVLLSCTPAELLLSPKQLERATQAVLFLSEPIPDREAWARPKALRICGQLAGREVPVLTEIHDITFGQAADIGAAMQELSQDVAALRVRVLATLLQPAYDGTDYDSDRVAVLEVLCGEVKLREALPLTDFFFAEFDRIRRAHAARLKRIPLSRAERSANIGQFSQEWDTLAVVDVLAGGDKSKWDYFYRLKWAEINTMIELENHKAYYRYQVHKQQERLQKADS